MDAIAMSKLEKKDQGFLVSPMQSKMTLRCRRCGGEGQLIYHWIKDGDSDIKMYRVRCETCGHVTSSHRSADLAIQVWLAESNSKK